MSQEQMQYPDPEVMPQAKRRRFSAEYEVRGRRNKLRHPAYARPELLATGPNQPGFV